MKPSMFGAHRKTAQKAVGPKRFYTRSPEHVRRACRVCGRRLAALLLTLLLTVQLSSPPARAVLSGVYFTAVNDELLELSQETMPFWSNNTLYVSDAVFSGVYSTFLGVACSRSINRQTSVLYGIRTSGSRNALFFDLDTGLTYDQGDNYYSQSAIERNGHVFFPLDLITGFFDLTYSYTYTSLVPLIRIMSDTVVLSDVMFIDAASDLMRQRYNDYEAAVTASPSVEPETTPSTPIVYTGQWIYLVFTVTDAESARSLLSTLSQHDRQATFLLSAGQMEDGDLVRSIVGGGHSVGLLAEGTAADTIIEQLEAANDALWQAARLRTRLVWLQDNQSRAASAVEEAGYCLMSCSLDYSRSPLSSTSAADRLYNTITAQSRTLTIFLGEDRDNIRGMNRFLSQLEEAQCRLLAFRETL